MLSNYNMTGQSMVFPPHVQVCMRGSLYVRPRHDFVQLHNELRPGPWTLKCGMQRCWRRIRPSRHQHRTNEQMSLQITRLVILAHGFCEHQRSAFFDVRLFQPNTMSCKSLEPKKYLSYAREWEEATVLNDSSRHWTKNIYTPNINHNRRNGLRMLDFI